MKASEIFCKPVVCEDKKRRGYILGISCVEDLIEGYICCNERENEFFAESFGVKFTDESAVIIKVGKQSKRGVRLKLGYPLYSEAGKFLGHVEDFTVKGNKIVWAHVGKRKYPFTRLTLGDVAVLKSARADAETAAKDMFIDALCSPTES